MKTHPLFPFALSLASSALLHASAFAAPVPPVVAMTQADDFWFRAVVAGVGAVIGVEARVWTHPTRARKLAARYQRHWPDFQLVPVAAPHALGMGLRAAF